MTITDALLETAIKAGCNAGWGGEPGTESECQYPNCLTNRSCREEVAMMRAALAAAQAGAPEQQDYVQAFLKYGNRAFAAGVEAACAEIEATTVPGHYPMMVARIRALRPPAAPAESDAPGTPLGRLNGIAEFVVSRGLCTGLEAKPPELFLMEAYDALSASEPAGVPSEKNDLTLALTALRVIADHPDTNVDSAAYARNTIARIGRG